MEGLLHLQVSGTEKERSAVPTKLVCIDVAAETASARTTNQRYRA